MEITTLARPYAQAVFELGHEQGRLSEWSATLHLLSQVVGHPDVVRLMASPNLGKAQRAQMLVDICADNLDEEGVNLLRLLAENNRLTLLPDIAALYEIERAAAESRIEAEVISATPLSEAHKKAITDALSRRLGREVTLSCTLDASLLGGAIVRAGDLVIDGSVTSKLNKLSAALLR